MAARPVVLALAAALLAGAARAEAISTLEPTPAEAAALDQGRGFVEVTPDAAGASGFIRAGIDIPAPREAVWRALTDCALAPRIAVGLKSCRVLRRDPEGRWDVREHVSRLIPLLPQIRTEFRSDYDPLDGFTYRRTGGDMQVLEGRWRLISLPGGKVRVISEGRAQAPFVTPGPMARLVLHREAAMALAALKRESLALAAQGG
ncbi:SRPBCC family protein [Phenylobacterium aquaticum]|uniref:SRPBCC family protein n=1 Tax=Phenylobacterium aquaticum TaxID=1763816 RepID=UPI001F5E1C3C|nr:SRPBCC family protein [Phenylobacterium aquaticum]MCI3135135.1 SRPBCC family protein [Phenylobacterium aquaticum]